MLIRFISPILFLFVVYTASAASPGGTQYLAPGTGCDESHLYQVMYSADGNHQVCDASTQLGYPVYLWLPLSGGEPTLLPGKVLPDGTIYAGGGVITTPTSAPGVYVGGCAPDPHYWWEQPSERNNLGATSMTDGAANTALEIAGSDTCSGDRQEAAQYCAALVAYGHDDWYLPAIVQLEQITNNMRVIGGFADSTSYWASTEVNLDQFSHVQNSTSGVYIWNLDSAVRTSDTRAYSKMVRCVR